MRVLSVLCASAVNPAREKLTAETPSSQRWRREEPGIRSNFAVLLQFRSAAANPTLRERASDRKYSSAAPARAAARFHQSPGCTELFLPLGQSSPAMMKRSRGRRRDYPSP